MVQIQFNYADYDDLAVQSRRCYEVCRKHNKPVIVMEPVREVISSISRRRQPGFWRICRAGAQPAMRFGLRQASPV